MKKSILDTIIEQRNGMYCHALEVHDAYELDAIVESIYSDFISTHTKEDIISFFSNIELYALDESNEEEIYNYNFEEAVDYCN